MLYNGISTVDSQDKINIGLVLTPLFIIRILVPEQDKYYSYFLLNFIIIIQYNRYYKIDATKTEYD